MAPTTRCGRSTTCAGTAATSWCGATSPRRRRAASAASSSASTTAGATTSTARAASSNRSRSSSTSTRPTTASCRSTARCGPGSSSSTWPSSPSRAWSTSSDRMVTKLENYPFDQLTERWFYRGTVNANWKLYMDAFQEFYHAPVLHAKQTPPDWSTAAQQAGFEAPAYTIYGPHRLVSTAGIHPWNLTTTCSSRWSGSRAAASSGPGTSRTSTTNRRRRASTPPAAIRGASTRGRSSRTSPSWSGGRSGISPTTTGRRAKAPTSSRARCISCRPRRHANGWRTSSPRCPSRSTGCRTPTRWRPPRRCSSRG